MYNQIIFNSILAHINASRKTSIFRETVVILFFIFGFVCTIVLFITLYWYCRQAQKRGKRKNITVDADYLINGLYL